MLSSHLSSDTEILNTSDVPTESDLWAYDISISNNCLLEIVLCHLVAAPPLARRSTPAAPISAFVFITTKGRVNSRSTRVCFAHEGPCSGLLPAIRSLSGTSVV